MFAKKLQVNLLGVIYLTEEILLGTYNVKFYFFSRISSVKGILPFRGHVYSLTNSKRFLIFSL
jgi:hypothetical protein